MTNNYLNDINNFPEETKKEFLSILKTNLTDFFNHIEIAIQNNDNQTIRELVHKVSSTLIMLELNSASDFFTNLKSKTIDTAILAETLNKLQVEKEYVIKKGWL